MKYLGFILLLTIDVAIFLPRFKHRMLTDPPISDTRGRQESKLRSVGGDSTQETIGIPIPLMHTRRFAFSPNDKDDFYKSSMYRGMYRANYLMPTFFENCVNCEEPADHTENSRDAEKEKEQIFKEMLYRIFK